MATTNDDAATRIQEAATALFAEHGFEGVSVRDIAQRAGVTVGSINYYFGSKQSLYQECGRRLTHAYLDEARDRLRRHGPRAVLEHYADFAVRDPKLIQIWLDLQSARDPEKRGFSNREIMHPIQALLIDAMEQLGERTLEKKLKMLCFVGAVILRSRLSDEQFEMLTDAPLGEANEVWRKVLFSSLFDD